LGKVVASLSGTGRSGKISRSQIVLISDVLPSPAEPTTMNVKEMPFLMFFRRRAPDIFTKNSSCAFEATASTLCYLLQFTPTAIACQIQSVEQLETSPAPFRNTF
jgi:hypothetical protein